MRTRRPDLEAQPFKAPPFIASRLFPPLRRAVKAGTIYYQDYLADASAQTDRTLASAPTATAIASSSTTWSASELIKRYKVDQSEVEQLGGLDAAQAKGARAGKRSVCTAIENLAVAATFGVAGSTITKADILASLIKAVATAVEVVRDYANGPVALFGARRVIDRIKRYSEVVDRMKFTGVLVRDIRDVRSISDEQLAAALDVDAVLAGPSTEWLGAGSAYDKYLGIAVLPDPAVDQDEEIQLGRTVVMGVPNDGAAENIYQVETYFSDDLISEVVDVRAWLNLLRFNPEACYVLDGCDESNATTTTTTGA